MIKELSCGGFIYNTNNEILITRSTGSSKWNIPKGKIEDNETPLECAIREIKEETNIDVSGCMITDAGQHKYLQYKDIHLFFFILHSVPTDIRCNSFFMTKYGTELPEIAEYKWCTYEEARLLWSDNLNKSIDSMIKYMKDNNLFQKYPATN